MSLVAVTANREAPGVYAPGFNAFTYDWRVDRGAPTGEVRGKSKVYAAPENSRGVRDEYEVWDLGNALAAEWDRDSHFVCYVVRDASGSPLRRQPRINKEGLEWLEAQGYGVGLEVLAADVDNPNHAEWTPELRAAAEAMLIRIPSIGWYMTRGGLRVVQSLTRPVAVARAEATLIAWLLQLEAFGLRVDWKCKDWTRHFRLPHVMRDGRPYRSPRVELSRLIPTDPPTVRGNSTVHERSSGPLKPRREGEVAFLDTLAERYLELAGALSAVIRSEGYRGDRHDVFLALAGALCSRRVPCEVVPALVASVAHAAGADADHHRKGAEATVRRWAQGAKVKGYRALPPELAEVVDRHTDRVHAQLRDRAEATPEPMKLDEALERLENALRAAPDGVSVVKAQCGLGKTRAAIKVALERAADGKKTAISVPTTALAKQVATDLGGALRFFGVLSEKGADGKAACHYHDAARALANGGQSVPWEICEGRGNEWEACDKRKTCIAYGGREGDGLVAVGPHAMLDQLGTWAGSRGLLVIDEPPSVLETQSFIVQDLEDAEGHLARFEDRFSASIAPALRAVRAWMAEPREPGPLARAFALGVDPELLEQAFLATGAESAEGAIALAFPEGARTKYPPIKRKHVQASKLIPSFARRLGDASKVYEAIYLALTSDSIARVEGPRLVITLTNQQLRRAVAREGAVVLCDANIDLHLPILEKLAGYKPPLVAASAPDGAPITRTVIRTRANRKGWIDARSIARDLDLVLAWIAEDPWTKHVGLVTITPVELLLRAALLGEDVSTEWAARGFAASKLAESVPILTRRLKCDLSLGHFGNVRGLDHWKGHDAIVTFGDPWPNLGDVAHDARFLGLPEGDERAEDIARAELEQAHGRLRTVHRTRPGRALHVGYLLPGGWREPVEVRGDAGGAMGGESAATPEALKALVDAVGGRRVAAALCGITEATMGRYLSGTRPVPKAVAETMSQFVGPGHFAPSKVDPLPHTEGKLLV